ncbi:MAG: hypothetical protein WBQ50_12890 [Nocardioides sp.]
MYPSRKPTRALTTAVASFATASLLVAGASASASATGAGTGATGTGTAATVERTPLGGGCFGLVGQTDEQDRASRDEPLAILARSGGRERVNRFARALCHSRPGHGTARLVDRHGHGLWRWATARAQGRIPVRGSLPGGDDRPLYWARVEMTRLLTLWTPRGGVSDATRERLLERLETVSRGQDTIRRHRADSRRTAQVVVTGFDPFTLDQDTRIGNPSGAVALALDGRRFRTAKGWVRIETAMFPVRWDDFTDGEVERTLAPHVRRGAKALTGLFTVSQGRPDQFDLEVWNGANRGGFADNENLERTGMIAIPDDFPTVTPQPQFTRSDLPARAMKRADTGAYKVKINHEITERDPDTGEERTTSDGPTPGFEAVSGGPGDYLSNEIAYRATLLRDAKDAGNVGGHVHTPVLGVPRGKAITDAGFESRRDAMVAQTKALVLKGAVVAARR